MAYVREMFTSPMLLLEYGAPLPFFTFVAWIYKNALYWNISWFNMTSVCVVACCRWNIYIFVVMAEVRLSIDCQRASLVCRKPRDCLDVSRWRNKHFWRLTVLTFCTSSLTKTFLHNFYAPFYCLISLLQRQMSSLMISCLCGTVVQTTVLQRAWPSGPGSPEFKSVPQRLIRHIQRFTSWAGH